MSETIEPASDADLVMFVVQMGRASPGFEPHGPAERLRKSVSELKDQYRTIVGQILAMVEQSPVDGPMSLKTVEVGLGFSAEGELGFIAKASARADVTISLTFERRDAP